MESPKTYRLKATEMDKLFADLKEKYVIYAPIRIPADGKYAGDNSVMYRQVYTYGEIGFEERSTYAVREVITPITQALFYFTEDEFRESKMEETGGILVFGKACSINAMRIRDQIFLENGDVEDVFYQRRGEKMRFALMEYQEQFDGCFCCSVGANVTDNYSIAISFGRGEACVEVKEEVFSNYFEGCQETNYEITPPAENEFKVDFPVIDSLGMVNLLKCHPIRKEFEARYIACGVCTVACSTCTCFETTDIIYSQSGKVGERRRTCPSCVANGFDTVASGTCFRETISEKYRYKILHKVYSHDARLHTSPVCVGYGRCSARCPQLIGYPETLDKLPKAIEDIRKGETNHTE